jgi:hypothetical protein
MKKLFTLLFVLISLLSFSQSTTIVISQAYGGGGGSTGTYLNDYVELHNVSSTAQSLNGMSLQYGSATGQFGSVATNIFALPNVSIPSGGYFLIQLSAAGTAGAALPVTPDAITTNLTMSGASGKVVLANQTTALGCGATATPCTLPSAAIIDLVAWGTSNNAEGGVSVNNGVAITSTQGAVRKTNGCTETDNNNADFDVITAPVPRNSASPAVICGATAPSLSISSPLPAFGSICINTTAGPNSFTISGSNLTAANVTVAALAGYTYSTTAGGTYTTTLSLTQPGGAFSQQVFVKFDPTAVQSYNGNITVGGGGASSVDAAASGAGVSSSVATVTSGTASAITQTSATVAGSITATGCSAITAYGIEYSTTAGFANGTGTAVASTNLSGAAFSSALSGLTLATTYYYHAYATNGTGTSYGAEQSFTTSSSTPTAGVVISQVYGGGGGATGTYLHDYVELHNSSSTAQSINGMSLQYGSSTGLFGSAATNIFALPNVSIPAGGYYLVQLSAAGTAGAALPVTPDAITTNLTMSGTSGKVVLANQVTALGCGSTAVPCVLPSASIVDLVAWGAANNAEGGVSVNNGVAITSTQGAVRKNNGCTDTDNNNADFDVVTAPVPRNSASPVVICGAGSPSLTISSPLAAFGNVCINTTAGPNSFTISGSNLLSTDVVVSALAGFTYSTTAGGTYTTTLNIPHGGGAFSQQVFVQFAPTAVQSYNGNIAVAGGGATAVNAAASGAGINTAPSVTSGAASAITQTTATVAGSITATGCSAVTAYGIEYSTTAGFANGTGTAVASTNLAAGNFSSDLAALATGTTYYYHAYATNAGGTSYGAEQSFTTATPNPTINATALTAFGNVCINTTAGPNSFTISGSNLTTADVTVAALAGYTYSTTAGGTYTTSLTLIQPGGTYSQEIFVKFDPTAVQSYDGNIVVNGGGIAAAVNVAAAGAGVNTAPSVTSGAASAITQTTATVAGNITATGCTAVTTYGIEYSTTNNFPNGTGTPVASTNLAAGSFSSALSGLTANTVYYYKAYATNAGGTTYGAQQTFTTAAPPPPAITVTALNGFGNICINTEAGPNSFIINGTNLTTANITVGPLAGYTFAETAGGTYTASLSITQTGGTQSKNVYVKFMPTAVQAYNGNIPVTGGGVTATINVAVTGAGVNTTPTVTTGAASTITTSSVVLTGTTAGNGCSPLTELGFEYSGINGFADGTGTKVLSTVAFSTQVTGLVQGATYYYKAYAKNAGGTGYGAQQSFTLTAIPNEFRIFPVPAQAGAELKFSINNLKPGYYALLFLDAEGKLVYQKNINIQATFINQSVTLPSTISKGTYRVQLVNTDDIIATKTILIL